MIVERSWLVDKAHVEPRFSTVRRTIPEFVSDGVLIPDARLQAITDAWNEGTYGKKFVRRDNPDLAALLDALTEE